MPMWLRWLVELDNPFTKTNRAAVIILNLDLRPGMSVLDVGCGPGRLAIPLSKQVGPQGQVVGMDIQSGMLDRAQIKAQSAMLTNIRFLQAAVGFLPPLLDRSLYDKTRGVPESAARKMCRRLAKEEGLFVGTSSGLNVVAALSLASELGPDKTVVTVACDTGLKYTAGDLFSDG